MGKVDEDGNAHPTHDSRLCVWRVCEAALASRWRAREAALASRPPRHHPTPPGDLPGSLLRRPTPTTVRVVMDQLLGVLRIQKGLPGHSRLILALLRNDRCDL